MHFTRTLYMYTHDMYVCMYACIWALCKDILFAHASKPCLFANVRMLYTRLTACFTLCMFGMYLCRACLVEIKPCTQAMHKDECCCLLYYLRIPTENACWHKWLPYACVYVYMRRYKTFTRTRIDDFYELLLIRFSHLRVVKKRKNASYLCVCIYAYMYFMHACTR